MSARPKIVDGLREKLLAKEKELSSVQEFLLEQDNDLRSCFHQVGDLELKLLANRPDSCSNTNTGCETPPPRTITPLRDELTSGDARTATAVAAQGNSTSSASAGNSNNCSSTSTYTASIKARSTVYVPSSSPSAGPPASTSSQLSPDNDSSRRRRIFPENATRDDVVADNGPGAPVAPPFRDPERERQYYRAGSGGDNPQEFRQRVSNGVGMVGLTASSSVAPEPRHAPAVAPYAPPSRPAAVAAAATAASALPAAAAAAGGGSGCASSPSSDEQRLRTSAHQVSAHTAESGGGGGGGGGGAGGDAGGRGGGGARGAGGEAGGRRGGGEEGRGGRGERISAEAAAGAGASPHVVGSHPRLAEDRSPFQEQGRRGPEGDPSRFAMELALAEREERVAHAERRAGAAGAAEAAERSAAASAVTAMRGARAAEEEAERLRVEGLELSRWREAVLDLRDALTVAERAGEGRGDGGGSRSDDDPVARHAQWVSSPALGALLPHLQEGARDLLSDLVAARARISAPATTATAASPPVAARSSGGGTTGTAAASDRGCTCALAVAEQWSRDEARSGGACRGETCGVEARSRSRSVEPQSRGGQQQCAVCAGVSDGADCSRGGVSCGGGGETAGVAAAAVVAAAVGLGVRHGVVEKSAASLKKECETLRMVVQALREKDEDSQKRIATLEEGVLQASLAAVERDALVSVLRRQLAPRDASASGAAEEDNGSRGRTASCTRGRADFKGSMDAVSTPEQDVRRGERGGPRSRLFAGGGGGVVVEPSPPTSTRLPRSDWNAAASLVGDESRCRRLSSSMLRSERQPDRSPRGPRQACAHSSLDSGCHRRCRQGEACSCDLSALVQADLDPSRDDSRYYPPCNGSCERGRTAVEVGSPSGQPPPSTPKNATTKTARSFTRSPPVFALRGGYRDRRGGGGGTGCGAEAEPASSERTPRIAKEEKRSIGPQVPTPTTDVIRRLLYESTPPASQMEPGGGSTGRIVANGRRLFSGGCTPGDSGNAVGVRGGGGGTATALFSDSPCRRSSSGSGDCRGGSGSRGMGARGGRNGDERVETAVLPARGNGGVGISGCSVGEAAASAMAGGRIAKGELVLRERLLQARRDFSALRTGVSADGLS